MRTRVLVVLLLLLCCGCQSTGLQGPYRTKEEFAGKFDVLKGKSAKNLPEQLKTEVGVYSARLVDVQQGPEGGKKYTVEWSHRYSEVYTTTEKAWENVARTAYDPKGKPSTYWAMEEVSRTVYHTKYFTVPCVTTFVSRDNLVDSYSSIGEGCLW